MTTPADELKTANTEILLRSVLRNVQLTSEGCWEWTGSRNAHGYGKAFLNGKHMGAHRWMWINLRGPIPAGLQLDHLCRNRACVNPEHLEPVEPGENIHRGNEARGKYICPEHGPKSRRPSGYLVCRPCEAEQARRRRAGLPAPEKAPRTHCVNGHDLDEVGAYVDRQGVRCCRECRRETSRRYRAARKAQPARAVNAATHTT